MALNPFFLQGSHGEQRLVQELINEQLKIYGVEVTYIPRKFVRKETILEEVTSSKFDDNFLLEAYVNTFDGYSGAGDIMTKFGVSLRDEVTLTISQERFEDFISPFLDQESDAEVEVTMRPREGDLIYFPLGSRLFEVKFVEHEQPFYQLGKTYVYELKCELFEYEDEIIDTSIEAIDTTVASQGHIIDLNLLSGGAVATATAVIGTNYVREIFLNNDGSGYTSTPLVTFTSPPAGFTTAKAVAITTTRNNITSIKEILITDAGTGYQTDPIVYISGGGGSGAAATAGITTDKKGIIRVAIGGTGGVGYTTAPDVTVTLPSLTPNKAAELRAFVGAGGTISDIRIVNAGAGFFSPPTIGVGTPAAVGSGNYWFNEEVTGSRSGATGRVKRWDLDTYTLQVGITTGMFAPGETITGAKSGANYDIKVSAANTTTDKYKQNIDLETEADAILDFSETNPFGTY